MKNPLLLGMLALFLFPTSLASAQSDNPYTAYDRKDVSALTRMAKAGDPVAQYNLGVMYGRGEGVEQNYTEAVKWYGKAADQGLAEAQYNLGFSYNKGEGVEQDYVQALKWYGKAVNQGLAAAQNNLGVMYKKGEGLKQDYVQALKWYNLSAAQGYETAKTNRDGLKALMTNAQIAEADRLSLNLQPAVQPTLAGTVPPPPTIRTVSAPASASTKITLSSNGKTIIISGNIESGSADRFRILLDAVPSVENVALVSSGGLLDEATEMSQAIKARGLDTYVDEYCMSACTMVFLGGRDRSATPQAKIGFHKPYLMADKPLADAVAEAEMRRFYDEANVRPSFTDKSMSTPSSEMWYPSFDELLASNVVTKRTLGGQVSAFANFYKKRADYENELLKSNFGSLLKIKHPDIFAKIIDAAWAAQQDGKTDGEVGNAMRAKIAENFSIIIGASDDNILDQYAKLISAQLNAARDISFDTCSLYLQGRLDIAKNLPQELVTRELALLEAALKSNKKKSLINEKQVEDILPKIFSDMTELEMQAIYGSANSSKIDKCNSFLKMYSAIEKMPMPDRVRMARYLLLSE
ncbi:hypothetical protein [Sphingorhabdus sp.]|jgi:hypothetical protein|uniref:hypothetical protein n=1 Tax=Sphingorhabdus sp. TaxID=1902408 RepID=UPI0037C62783